MTLEEGGKAVNSFIDALKSQPLSLALVVMNIGLLGYLYYQGSVAASERHHEMDLLYQNRETVAKLLQECGPPTRH